LQDLRMTAAILGRLYSITEGVFTAQPSKAEIQPITAGRYSSTRRKGTLHSLSKHLLHYLLGDLCETLAAFAVKAFWKMTFPALSFRGAERRGICCFTLTVTFGYVFENRFLDFPWSFASERPGSARNDTAKSTSLNALRKNAEFAASTSSPSRPC